MLDAYSNYSDAKAAAQIDLRTVPHNPYWDTGEEQELKIHRIHAYPAKFPAFITTKALHYARSKGMKVNRIADVFCGCGTVAFEAQRESLAFWGCDINPVATLIARAKSHVYAIPRLSQDLESIKKQYAVASRALGLTKGASDRIKYWFDGREIRNLARLKNAILDVTSEGSKYRDFFLCAFSNILKPTSKWLTKSIKPQIDPHKVPNDVMPAFQAQCQSMIRAFEECSRPRGNETNIQTSNFLTTPFEQIGNVDVIVTSPPYVTSYEYADLHQLSSLWLGFAEDYRDLRNGSIGTMQHDFNFSKEVKRLNESGTEIVFSLYSQDSRAARAVAKYYLDMQQVARRCSEIISRSGMVLFVIGNTSYKGVRIDNARHLAESLLEAGFSNVSMARRLISNKILTPYRDPIGRFSHTRAQSQIYGEEYILIADR